MRERYWAALDADRRDQSLTQMTLEGSYFFADLHANDIRTIGRHPLASIGSFQPSRIVNIAVALRGHSECQPSAIVLPR